MKIEIGKLKRLIKEALNEMGPTGKLRQVRGAGGRQVKIGRIEDENKELSFSEAEMLYPGSTDAWAEIVPSLYPDFPFADDPSVVKRRSAFFKIGPELRVAFEDQPQLELATWNPDKQDWVENQMSN